MNAFAALLVLSFVHGIRTLDNGLALTPPMGFLSWEKFRCNVNCTGDPNNCISEKLYMQMADVMASDGYRDAGYQYVNIDDCWPAKERDNTTHRLVPDPQRFPGGIKALADYVHSKGLKLGIYEDYGTETCGGYPGVIDHMQLDAQTFAEWEVDMVKLDGCYSDPKTMDKGYPEFGRYLNETARPMVYSCSWPVYQFESGIWPNYTAISTSCNLWRNWDDIQNSWYSVSSIIDFFADLQWMFTPNAGPGQWNDPDMLIIGDSLTLEQSKTQMALWSIMAAPLLMSADLRSIKPEFKSILLDKDVIAIDQDPLGIQGSRILQDDDREVWTRPISPVREGNQYSYAIAYFNHGRLGQAQMFNYSLQSLGLVNPTGYQITQIFGINVPMGHFAPNSFLKSGPVKPTSTLLFLAIANPSAPPKTKRPFFDPASRFCRMVPAFCELEMALTLGGGLTRKTIVF